MGSNSGQAQGIVLLLIGFALLAGAFASGGSVIYFIAAAIVLALSIWRFRACKALESSGSSGD